MKHKAFTLAEVLITLGIIGVVAAFTIPGLISRYQEKEMVNRWVKFYSLLQQAVKLAEEEYGDHTTWKWDQYNNGNNPNTEGSAYSYLKPYLKLAYDCPTGGDKCSSIHYKQLDNRDFQLCSYYGPAVKLLSGEMICFIGGDSPNFVVDLNRSAKPNKIGVDVHYFSFYPLHGDQLLPGFNWGWLDFSDNAEYCNTESSTWHNGASCGFWIKRYKNMDYLHMSKDEVKAKWKHKTKSKSK